MRQLPYCRKQTAPGSCGLLLKQAAVAAAHLQTVAEAETCGCGGGSGRGRDVGVSTITLVQGWGDGRRDDALDAMFTLHRSCSAFMRLFLSAPVVLDLFALFG